MLYGVIDLGSNTVRLVIYKKTADKLVSFYSHREVIGLASYVSADRMMRKEGIEQAVRIVKELKNEAEALKTDFLYVIATAAIRNAKNSVEIVQRIRAETAVDVHLLTGLEEAQAGIKGISSEYQFADGIVIDIGGGSTEVSVIEDQIVIASTSLPLGSLNSYITYVKNMLPSDDEKLRIQSAVIKALKVAKINPKKRSIMYGVGGTLNAAKKLISYDDGKERSYLMRDDITDLLSTIDPNKKDTYLNLVRLVPERFHTIMPGLIILEALFEYFNVERLYIGKSGIREGYVLSKIEVGL